MRNVLLFVRMSFFGRGCAQGGASEFVEQRMLVLTRKPGQSVYIGDEIKITLKEIRGNQVRLGIDAPPSVRIFREEIYLQIMEENRSAAGVPAGTPTDLGEVAKAWRDRKAGGIPQFKAPKKRDSEDSD